MTGPELRARLLDLWATLDSLGAVVHRRRGRLSARTLAAMCAHEAERVRVLTAAEAEHIVTARRGAA